MKNLENLSQKELISVNGGADAEGWGRWIGYQVGKIAGSFVAAAEETYEIVKGVVTS
jgi:hypothetical protein